MIGDDTMNLIKTSITINIVITDTELIAKIEVICTELSISLDQFMLFAINKLIYDIQFIRNLRCIDGKPE